MPLDVAPELILAGYTTHQSDIYQMGLILYYLYKGVPALGKEDGNSGQAIATGIARYRAEAIGTALFLLVQIEPSLLTLNILQKGTPLGDCIARMLRRHVDWRYRDTIEVWTELCRAKEMMIPSTHQALSSSRHSTSAPMQPQPHASNQDQLPAVQGERVSTTAIDPRLALSIPPSVPGPPDEVHSHDSMVVETVPQPAETTTS